MESKVIRHGEREDGGRRPKPSGKGGSRQSRLGGKGDGGGSEEAKGVDMCSPMKGNAYVLRQTPNHASIPPYQNGTMAKDGW